MSDKSIAEGRAAFLKVRKLLDEAAAIAYAEVERRARHALRTKPGYGFCMAMGSASFHKDGDHETKPWQASTLAFIDEYDAELKLTGMPMRIDSADAPLRKEW